MVWIFSISLALLVGFVVAVQHRLARVRSGHVSQPHLLDRMTTRLTSSIRTGVRDAVQYVHSDVLLKGLHVLTYVALVAVRFLEHKLVHVVHRLRTFRKERVPGRPTHKLAHHDATKHTDG